MIQAFGCVDIRSSSFGHKDGLRFAAGIPYLDGGLSGR